jgi:hypothetical protein
MAQSGHADRRARPRSSATGPGSSRHAGAARSAAPNRRRLAKAADQALERSSCEAREDPAGPQRRRAVGLPDAELPSPAAPRERRRPRLVRAPLSPVRSCRPTACRAAKRGIQPRARPDHPELSAGPGLGQPDVRQRRLRACPPGRNRLPAHVPRDLGKLPGRGPSVGLPPSLLPGPGVLLPRQNVALVPSPLAEVVRRIRA